MGMFQFIGQSRLEWPR